MPEPHDKLGWALEIASRGFMIHPLPIDGKAPALGFSWKNIRTTDPARIRAWFADNPHMNYGVSPGSGGVILDLDQNKVKPDGRITAGIDRFAELEAEYGAVRGTTFMVSSPSEGIHLYLLTKEPVTNHSGFPLDIDVRGESGYVVGPGCYYDGLEKPGDKDGYYEVVSDQAFLQAPDWITQRCRADILNVKLPDLIELDLESNINQGKSFLTKQIPAFEGMPGTGDLHTFKTACVLCHNYALSREKALELMAHWQWTDEKGVTASWNERCSPPWEVYGTGNECLEFKVRNGDLYGKQQRGEMSGALMLQGLDLETVAQAEAAAIQAVEEIDENRRRLTDHLMRGDEIFKRIKPMRWIIPFWLPGDGVAGIVGESGVGKSTVLLDMALTLAHDMDWHENETRKGQTVIYTAGEDYQGAGLQIRAWCRAKGVQSPSDRFIFMPEVPPLGSVEEVNLWIDVFKEKIGTKDIIVFIDTWQRATSGLSQNDEREMQNAINAAEAIGRAIHGPVVVAFHSPKSNRDTVAGVEHQRNSSNALWFLERDQRGVKLEARKVRGGARGNKLILDYVEYETGLTDEYFKFPLRHVVPRRIGGHRILPDGTVYKEENLDAVRHAVAEVLWMLEHKRKDDTNSNTHYTPKHAAERIVGSPDHTSVFGRAPLADRNDEWACEAMDALAASGLKLPMDLKDMEDIIKKCLGPTGFIFEDGRRVAIQKIGNQYRIVTSEEGGLTT